MMKAKNIKVLLSGIILLTMVATSFAQESTTMFFMKGMPQASMYNPALHNDSSALVLGLPVLSGVYVDMNSDFAMNDLIHYGTGSLSDSLIIDLDGFNGKLKSQNTLRQNLEVSLFFLGFRTRNTFISFAINEKESAQFGFDKSLITFLKDGNAPYIGQNYDLGNMKFNAFHYREYSLGVSNEFMNGRLSVGARIKALYGKFAVKTDNLNFKVKTAADASSIELQTDMQVNFSSPFTPKYDEKNFFNGFDSNISATDYIFQSDNMGMAFDLGAVFKVNPKITVSASIVDIGKIPFKTDAYNINHKKTYNWTGLDFSNSLDDTKSSYISASDMVDDEMDKLEDVVRPSKSDITEKSFDMPIPTKVYLGGTYKMNEKLDFGVLDRMYMYDGKTTNSLTLSANAMFGKFFSLTGSYSAVNGTYSNLGLGWGLRAGFLQFYMVNDNLLALADPAKAKFVNIRFGLNILFGRNYKNFVN